MHLWRHKGYLSLVILALVMVAAPSAPVGAEGLRTVTLPGPGFYQRGPHGERVYRAREAAADRLVIGLRPGVGAQGASGPAALATQGGGKMRRLLARARLLVVDLPAGSDLQAAAARYLKLPNVIFAVPDTVVYPSLVPNDPNYNQQYHLPLMRAPAAWDVTTGATGTIIAFVDSGVDLNHPDLAARIWNNPNPGSDARYPNDVHGWNFAGNNNNVSPVPLAGGDNSIVSHGTLTAGIAAAVANEGYGTAGMDWKARIMELKVFEHDGTGATASTIVEAMDYAVAHGAKVLNLSLGEPGFNETYSAAIEEAYAAGVVIVAAAGNRGVALTNSVMESPVCNDGPNAGDNMVIGVASTDQSDYKADFSDWDQSSGRHYVDVSAPGVAVYGTIFQDSTFAGFTGYFGTNDGTSFSCPMAAGLAALILGVHPSYTPAQVMAAIKSGADNIDTRNPGYAGMLGAGRINMARSLGVISPPQAVSNVQAADTPGDAGGSLTVTWLKSGDDGGGARSVTKYTVLRRQGTTGSFAAVGDAAAGAQQYLDNTTTDGLPYYYQVRTYAGTLYSDSAVAGPAQSRDDSPPPAVTTLQAGDRPSDSGGAINLSWSYTPPADFQAYRVYRDAYAFSTILGRAPIYTITDKTKTAHTDGTVVDGVDYYYALTAVDTAGNERAAVTPVGPVQSYPNQNVTFPAGLQLVTTPALPADLHPATLLGIAPSALHYARWDTAGAQYLYYTSEPLPAALKLALGAGFWLNLAEARTIAPSGQSAPAGDYPVSVIEGWRLLGNPFFSTLDFDECTVTTNGNTMDLDSAQTAGLLTSTAWVWDAQAKSYRMVNGGSTGSTIAAWQGFWVKGLGTCTLNLARGTAEGTDAEPDALRPQARRAKPVAQTAAKPVVQWRVRLTAQAGAYNDLDNYCGVASVARQVESPPLPGAGVELALGSNGEGPVALKYYTPGAGTITQPVTVSWTGLTGAVRVAWPEINTLPAGRDFLLKDLATGQVTNLRVTPVYVFQATRAAGSREFTLTITPQAVGMVTVSQVSAQATAQGAQLVFVLSRSANCDIKILNLAGRVVRQLAVGTLQPAGASTVLWDGRSDIGVRVPGGRYLVSLEARDDQGGRARIVRDLAVTR